jgi:dolichol-phosphate mannosyltransferase
MIIMDADFSHYLKSIPELIHVHEAKNYDAVTGTRYSGDGAVYGWDLKKKLVFKGANIFADTILRLGVGDLTVTFRLYKKN